MVWIAATVGVVVLARPTPAAGSARFAPTAAAVGGLEVTVEAMPGLVSAAARRPDRGPATVAAAWLTGFVDEAVAGGEMSCWNRLAAFWNPVSAAVNGAANQPRAILGKPAPDRLIPPKKYRNPKVRGAARYHSGEATTKRVPIATLLTMPSTSCAVVAVVVAALVRVG